MDKQDMKVKQIQPLQIEPGIHTKKLAIHEMEEFWHTVIGAANWQFKDRCTQHCKGCKQLSNPTPCDIARVRYGMLDYAQTTPYGRFQQAIIEDLKDEMFRDAPFYNAPA